MGQGVREEAWIHLAFGKGVREGFTWEVIFKLHLPIRGDFQAKRVISVHKGPEVVPFMTRVSSEREEKSQVLPGFLDHTSS